MLYHPQSPYYAQFLQAGARMNRRMDAVSGAGAQPVPSAASAA